MTKDFRFFLNLPENRKKTFVNRAASLFTRLCFVCVCLKVYSNFIPNCQTGLRAIDKLSLTDSLRKLLFLSLSYLSISASCMWDDGDEPEFSADVNISKKIYIKKFPIR